MSLVGFKGRNHPQQTGKRGALNHVDDRGTPPEVFGPLNQRFGFTLDVAAAPHNAKCQRFYTIADDGLVRPWDGRVWCNPPYSDIGAWLEKAWVEWRSRRPGVIVMLLPANRTEQPWWHDHVEPHRMAGELRVEFIRGRTRFILPGRSGVGPNERPPFGCCLLIWERSRCEVVGRPLNEACVDCGHVVAVHRPGTSECAVCAAFEVGEAQ